MNGSGDGQWGEVGGLEDIGGRSFRTGDGQEVRKGKATRRSPIFQLGDASVTKYKREIT